MTNDVGTGWRSRQLVVFAALGGIALLAAIAALAVLGQPAAHGPSVTPDPALPAAAPGWTRLPPSPLAARESATMAWTGSEVIVLGGSDAPPCPPNADCVGGAEPLRDGAAYDVATRTWRRIADAPIGIGSGSVAVVAGQVHVWVDGIDGPSFIGYDIASDTWRQLPLPVAAAVGRRLVAWDDRVVAWATSHEGALGPDIVFDPASESWAELPPDPLGPMFDRWTVAAADRLVVLGVPLVANPGVKPTLYRAAVLDPATEAWQRLPDSEIVGFDPTWYAFGDLVVNPTLGSADGGEVNNWGRSYPFGGMLDLGGPAWLPLPGGPAEAPSTGIAAATGTFVVNGQGWALDVVDLGWFPVGAPPDAPQGGTATVGAGNRIVVFGGSRFVGARGELLDGAWEWAPPS